MKCNGRNFDRCLKKGCSAPADIRGLCRQHYLIYCQRLREKGLLVEEFAEEAEEVNQLVKGLEEKAELITRDFANAPELADQFRSYAGTLEKYAEYYDSKALRHSAEYLRQVIEKLTLGRIN